jgi:hypothetical protein
MRLTASRDVSEIAKFSADREERVARTVDMTKDKPPPAPEKPRPPPTDPTTRTGK